MDWSTEFELKEMAYNCRQCDMGKEGIYSPYLKCCTYFPFIPNYDIGRILSKGLFTQLTNMDPLKKGRFTPLGLIAGRDYQLEFYFKTGDDFGWREDLLCPFYDEGNCKIWKFRNSQCRSFHCKFQNGDLGQAYWQAYYDFHHYLEMTLSQTAAVELGFSWKDIEDNLEIYKISNFENEENTELLSPNEPFYIRAWELTEARSKEEVLNLLGSEGRELKARLLVAQKNIMDERSKSKKVEI